MVPAHLHGNYFGYRNLFCNFLFLASFLYNKYSDRKNEDVIL